MRARKQEAMNRKEPHDMQVVSESHHVECITTHFRIICS